MPHSSQLGLRLAGGCLVIAAAASLSAAGPQTLASQAPTRPTGLVLGRVIDGATNAPLTGVLVTISGGGIRPKRVIVDAQGRFLFHELPAGAFTIAATKAGYLNGSYGMLRPDGSGRPLELQEGERVTDATVRLWRFSTISGTVLDDAGDPVLYERVQAFRRTVVAGRWRLVNTGLGGSVDEKGTYRITGLLPGDYALVITSLTSALPQSLLQLADAIRRAPGPESGAALNELWTNGAGGYANDLMQGFATTKVGNFLVQGGSNLVVGADGESVEKYPTTWYPGAATPADASLVTIGPGDNRSGVDLRPTLKKMMRISGSVVGADGRVAHLALRLVPANLDDATAEITSSLSLSLTTAMAATDANGAFTFLAVPPGQYIIRAVTTPRPPPEPPPPAGAQPLPPMVTTDPTRWAAVPVSVGDSDTTGVVVTLRAGIRVTGRVEFDGAAAKPTAAELRAIRVSMESADGRTVAAASAYRAQIDPNSRFYTTGLMAGRYLIRVDAVPKGWTVKSAIVGGRDICDVPLPVESDDVAGLVLTFTDRPTHVSGIVRNAQGRPDEEATVLVFASDGVWTDLGSSPRRMRALRASRTGAFAFSGLPAGDYFIIAVSDALAASWQEPAFLQKLARVATRISLADRQALSQNLSTTGGIAR